MTTPNVPPRHEDKRPPADHQLSLDEDCCAAAPPEDFLDLAHELIARAAGRSPAIRCPAALRSLKAWLIWKFEPHDNPGGKPRKVPWYAAGGRRFGDHGTPEDRRQLVTFDEARTHAARRGFDGVGFATLADFGIVALDFDACVDAAGEIHPEVQAVLGTTYCELSPSGTGVRAFLRGQLGNRKSHAGERWPFGLETFSTNGFVTFTGRVLPLCELMGNEDEVAPVDQPVLDLYARRFTREIERQAAQVDNPDRLGLTEAELRRALQCIPNDDLPYEADDGPSWLGVGMALHHETNGEGFELWDEWSQTSSKYGGPEYGMDRWRSFDRGTGPVVTGRSLVLWANEGGAGLGPNAPASAEDFEAVAGEPANQRFAFEQAASFAAGAAPEWIIKGVVPDAGLMVLFGASGSGKTFVALDMVAAIARGVPWRGLRVRQRRVAYIAAEGAGGFRNRLRAYATANQLDLSGLDVHVLAGAPNLLLKPDIVSLGQALVALRPGVVVVDTFAQTTPGANENSGEDVGLALANVRALHELTGALVILVHHSGKDASRGARGWSGLRAACDAELEVVRLDTGRAMRVSKQKDGEDGLELGFELEPVQLGIDSDGDPIRSCVVVDAQLPQATVIRPMGRVQAVVFAVAQELTGTVGRAAVAEVLAEAATRLPAPEDGKRDRRPDHVRRALRELCADASGGAVLVVSECGAWVELT